MAEVFQTNRTWLCSVLFMDVVNYSSQSVELQIKWKERFNNYLGEAIKNVPENERVILDTGDGAAICFLGAPEAAMFAAFEVWHFLLLDGREQHPPLRVRIGINLGPVKLVRDINGAPNAIGDGMNAGQRVMSFAGENQILVSQSYFEVVSRLSDDYKTLFTLKGVERDKHIREHTVYTLSPPGAEQPRGAVNPPPPTVAEPPSQPESIPRTAPPPASAAKAGSRSMQLLLAGAVVLLIAAAGIWFFLRSEARSVPAANPPVTGAAPVHVATTNSVAPNKSAAPILATDVAASKSKPAPPLKHASSPDAAPEPPPDRVSEAPTPTSSAHVRADAQASYEAGVRLLEDRDNPTQAVRYFDDAIRAQPGFIEAYIHRAEARRRLLQHELSLKDCNKVIQLVPADPKGYNCRGYGEQLLMQYDASLADFSKALRLDPNFGLAYGNRGASYNLTHQYALALKDLNEAIRLLPRNHLFYIRRGNAYSNLKQYAKAIADYTEAIRLSPKSTDAYHGRAVAEQAMGDTAGAAADRARIREVDRARAK